MNSIIPVSLQAPALLCAPAIGWMITFLLLMAMVRESKLSLEEKIFTSILLTIPAYILYAPICTVSSVSTTPFLGSQDYGPTPIGMVIGSAIATVFILWLGAIVVRRQMLNHRAKSEATADNSPNEIADRTGRDVP